MEHHQWECWRGLQAEARRATHVPCAVLAVCLLPGPLEQAQQAIRQDRLPSSSSNAHSATNGAIQWVSMKKHSSPDAQRLFSQTGFGGDGQTGGIVQAHRQGSWHVIAGGRVTDPKAQCRGRQDDAIVASHISLCAYPDCSTLILSLQQKMMFVSIQCCM